MRDQSAPFLPKLANEWQESLKGRGTPAVCVPSIQLGLSLIEFPTCGGWVVLAEQEECFAPSQNLRSRWAELGDLTILLG